jgi:hypothetical protein
VEAQVCILAFLAAIVYFTALAVESQLTKLKATATFRVNGNLSPVGACFTAWFFYQFIRQVFE